MRNNCYSAFTKNIIYYARDFPPDQFIDCNNYFGSGACWHFQQHIDIGKPNLQGILFITARTKAIA
jgi:hypothetical protein